MLIISKFVYVKANKRIQQEDDEKKVAQEKQAKLECVHVCIAMVIGMSMDKDTFSHGQWCWLISLNCIT